MNQGKQVEMGSQPETIGYPYDHPIDSDGLRRPTGRQPARTTRLACIGLAFAAGIASFVAAYALILAAHGAWLNANPQSLNTTTAGTSAGAGASLSQPASLLLVAVYILPFYAAPWIGVFIYRFTSSRLIQPEDVDPLPNHPLD